MCGAWPMGGRGEGGEAAAMKCEVPNAANQGTNELESLFLIVVLHLGIFSNVLRGQRPNARTVLSD